ncbi:MAG: 5'-3' exonuclease H3TH domain-containing protein [Wenzhouxiangellaceae bacterium]|nr:5'-3' exonuclease H3TH domain-containing protein [Wenzhouxiangellaceae bacterium]
MSPAQKPTVHLIDASIYIFRAWYSMPEDFSDPQGRPTNAVYGFARFLCELLEQTGSSHAAVAFDESLSKSFRSDIFPEYKANREPAPEDLKRQFAWCKDLAGCLGLPVYIHDRFEADDLIAALHRHWGGLGHPIAIITGDKDLAQLVGPTDTWWDFARRNRLDAAGVEDKFGVRPSQIADFLALTGDKVDNIPGVPGVGPKTAAALLQHFDSIDGVYGRLDEIGFLKLRGAKALIPRLRMHEQAVRVARQLTGLQCDIAEIVQATHDPIGLPNRDGLDALLDALGFGNMLRERLHRLGGLR